MSKESLIEEVTKADGAFQRMTLFSDKTVVDLINKHLPEKIKKGDYVVGISQANALVCGEVTNETPDFKGSIMINDYHLVKASSCRLATELERDFLDSIKI